MAFTSDNRSTTCATRLDVTFALSDPERLFNWTTVDMGANFPSFKTAFPELSATTSKTMIKSFREHLMSSHIDTKA